jgi:GTP cyclohydrolase I
VSQANNTIRAKRNAKPDPSENLRIIADNYSLLKEMEEKPSVSIKKENEDDIKINTISWHFEEIMKTLGLDLEDDSLRDTPKRVAKMYVKEVFQGLDPKNKPEVTLFENKFQYNEMLVERDIKVHSFCEHHFVPILGKAHVAYISSGKVIGLSKINRIVNYYSRRPQVQERLTEQIAEELKKVLQTDDVAVIIEADHMCVIMRGVEDEGSSTTTASYHGKFKDREYRNDFLTYVYQGKH